MKREIKFIFFLIIFFFIVWQNFQKFLDLTKEFNIKKIELSSLSSYYNQIKENIAEIKKEQNFERLEKIIPPDPREAELLNTILTIAAGEGVSIEKFSVSKKMGDDEINKITFTIQAAGDYFSLKNFVSRLQLLERIPIFESFSISKEKKATEEKIMMNIVFSVFSL